MAFAQQYLDELSSIISQLNLSIIEQMVSMLSDLRNRKGRLFFLGIGGNAANSSHAANDFRRFTKIEAWAATDNIAEFSGWINDEEEGWNTVFKAWLKASNLEPKDMLFILSVSGGNLEKNISPNIVRAVEYAKTVGTQVIGIVGDKGGYTAQVADACVIIPKVNEEMITPYTEALQPVIWHLLVRHPLLKINSTNDKR